MKRQFDTLFARNEASGYRVGDEIAHRAAAALADRADAPTIQVLADILAMSDLIGGQFHVTTIREKVDRYGNPVADGDGEWATVGLHVRFETRDVTVEYATAPDEVYGLPVTPSHERGTVIEVPAPEGPAEIDALVEEAEIAAEDPDPIEEPVALTE